MERVDLLHDVGSSLNPALDRGQVEGAFIQGMGWLTGEELVWNAKGVLTTHAPSTYKIPTAADVPEVFNVSLVANSPNRGTPFIAARRWASRRLCWRLRSITRSVMRWRRQGTIAQCRSSPRRRQRRRF